MKQRILRTLFLLGLFSVAGAAPAQNLVFQFTEGLSVPLTGEYGREALCRDLLLWRISENAMEIPAEGTGAFYADNGTENNWSAIEADEKGIFRHRNLRGGYLYCEYFSKKNQVVILEANGHNEVFVNGQPRGGDVYNYGWVQHPVKLIKGKNTFLFRGSRGQISASLSESPTALFLSDRDPLLPDLVEGRDSLIAGAVRVINKGEKDIKGYKIISLVNGNRNEEFEIPQISPLTSRKVPFYISAGGYAAGDEISLSFILKDSRGREVYIGESPDFKIIVKGPYDRRKETFISGIDGSVQYYSIVPPSVPDLKDPALFFTMHGASVEAVNQAAAYSAKDWGILVAPTNRRPYGFDWEDWGRLDAREVLAIVKDKYKPDPSRFYLTGHSMGGHGAWQFGVTYPGYWAAIGPSAGWYSFWSYAGKEEIAEPEPLENVFIKASNPSNTLALSENYLHYGIYVLHGDADDNVPVGQARFMREHLAGFHADFCYYEKPGAGHWWGNECVDWPPMFQFFKNHRRPELNDIVKLSFSTACPGISSELRFITVWQQEEDLEISRIEAVQDIKGRQIKIESDNVLVLKLDLGHLQAGQPYTIICESDSFRLDPAMTGELFLEKTAEGWAKTTRPGTFEKGPHRYGMFKEAFRNKMIFVYGTGGTREENEWAYSKARFDAETFWYRGNGSVDVVSDTEFLKNKPDGRNIILYGHSEMNRAWDALLADCPLNVGRGKIRMGEKNIQGDDIGAYFIYPANGEDYAMVGVVAGTGLPGMVSAYPNRYFVSGSGFPDFMFFRSEILKTGINGVLAAGFFDRNWKLGEKNAVFAD